MSHSVQRTIVLGILTAIGLSGCAADGPAVDDAAEAPAVPADVDGAERAVSAGAAMPVPALLAPPSLAPAAEWREPVAEGPHPQPWTGEPSLEPEL